MYDPQCKLCPLHEVGDAACLPAKGPETRDPEVLFLTADVRPEGPPWKLLKQACEEYGITNWALTSVVKCPIPRERKAPYVKEVAACAHYLEAELEALRPEWVVPLGNVALKQMTGQTGITKFAGREWVDDYPDRDCFTEADGSCSAESCMHTRHTPRIFPMIDPAAVLHDDRQLATLEQGFSAFRDTLDGKSRALEYPQKTTEEAMEALNEMAAGCVEYAMDYETTGLNPRFHTIRTVAFATAEGEAWWTVWDDALIPALFALFASGATMRAQNAVFEVKWSLWHVVRIMIGDKWRQFRWPVRDSMLFHHLWNENEPHNLSYLSKEYTSIGGYDDDMATAKAADSEAYKNTDLHTLGNYNAGDSDACWRLVDFFWEKIEERDEQHGEPYITDLYNEITEPAIWTVAHCELHGWKFDVAASGALHSELLAEEVAAMRSMLEHPTVQRFQDLKRDCYNHDVMRRAKKAAAIRTEKDPEEKNRLRAEIQMFDKTKHKPLSAWGEYPQGTFNPGSAGQVRELLFGHLGVPVIGYTDSDLPSTGEKFLRPVEEDHPFLTTFLHWKKANTLRQKDLEGKLFPYIQKDGFVYSSFMLHGTVSGRWASEKINLQNQTPRLKPVFVSRFPGGQILEADFAQLELRLMAWACGCVSLLKAFEEGLDPHAMTALDILGRAHRDKEERKRKGKEPNFGYSYGAYPGRFSLEFGVPLREAKLLFKAFHKSKPEIQPWLTKAQGHVGTYGWIKGYLGRVRTVVGYDDDNFKKRMHALLSGSNFPIQNLGAELTTWAFNHAAQEVNDLGLRSLPLGAVHDSLLFDCPPEEVEQVRAICKKWMTTKLHERFPWLTVPMVADVECGPNWGELSESFPAVSHG